MDERPTATEDATGGGQLLRITWVKSAIGYRESQRLTIKSLGLRKLNQTVLHYDSPSIRGMLTKVRHLVRVEEAESGTAKPERVTGTQRFEARRQRKAAAYQALMDELAVDAAGGATAEPAQGAPEQGAASAEEPAKPKAAAASPGEQPAEPSTPPEAREAAGEPDDSEGQGQPARSSRGRKAATPPAKAEG
jgi:large subunit ribosomal protein L30